MATFVEGDTTVAMSLAPRFNYQITPAQPQHNPQRNPQHNPSTTPAQPWHADAPNNGHNGHCPTIPVLTSTVSAWCLRAGLILSAIGGDMLTQPPHTDTEPVPVPAQRAGYAPVTNTSTHGIHPS